MKKITLLFALLIALITTGNAQTFVGKRPELLIGKEVKITPPWSTYTAIGYSNFYIDDKMLSHYEPNEKIRVYSKFEKLKGRIFKVESVEPYEEYDKVYKKIKLFDPTTNETVFYKFDENDYSNGEYFLEAVGGLTLPDDFYCDFITSTKSKYDGTVEYSAGILEGVTVVKTIDKAKKVTYSVKVKTISKELKKFDMFSVVFANEARIERLKAPVTVIVNSMAYYEYLSSAVLTPKELDLFTNNKVKSLSVSGIYKSVTDGDRLQHMVQCLITKN